MADRSPLEELENNFEVTGSAPESAAVSPESAQHAVPLRNEAPDDLNDRLNVLIRLQESANTRSFVSAVLLAVLLLAVLISTVVNIQAQKNLGLAADTIGTFLDEVDVEALNGAVASLRDTADSLNEGIDTEALSSAVSGLKTAADILSELDIASLNTTVSDLRAAAVTLEDSFGRLDMDSFNDTVIKLNEAADSLSDIDTDSLNELVSSLNTVAESLENTTNKFSNLFGGGLFNKDKDKEDSNGLFGGLFNKDKGND